MAGGGGLDVRGQAVECGAVGVEFIGPLLGHDAEWAAFFPGAADGFVVHVGEVAHVLHLAGELQVKQAAEEVIDHESAEVAYVRGGINGWSAVIEAVNAVGLTWGKRAGCAGKGIVEGDGHEENRATKGRV